MNTVSATDVNHLSLCMCTASVPNKQDVENPSCTTHTDHMQNAIGTHTSFVATFARIASVFYRLSCTGEPKTEHSTPNVASKMSERMIITFLDLPTSLLLMQPSIQLGFTVARVHC